MSDPDEGNPSPGGRESPLDELGAWIGAAGEEDAEILDSESQGDEDEAAAALVAAEVAEAMESLGEEAGAMGDPEDSTSEEDSDIGPADEEEENMEQGQEMAIDAHQFPMVGFRFMFLNLLHGLLHRMHYNNHILVRPRGVRRMARSRHQRPGRMAQIRVLLMPEGSRERVVAMVPHGSRERVVAMVHQSGDSDERSGVEFPALPEPIPEPEGQATDAVEEESDTVQMSEEAEEEPAQEAEASEETTEEAAQAAESDQEKVELNQNQEEPE